MGTNFSRKLGGGIIAALLLAAVPPASVAMTCSGADPAVVSVDVAGMRSNGSLNTYTMRAKVVNLGRTAQASTTLQFVDIYKGPVKQDSRGIPPLAAGQSYTFDYATTRSADAGAQTSALAFRMDVRGTPSIQDCNTGNGITMVRF
jgi:hypothetical protein